MGISLNFAPLVVRTLAGLEGKTSLITLGRQHLDFGPLELQRIADDCGAPLRPQMSDAAPMTQEEFFGRQGVDDVHSLDISDFEGASHLLDLNAPPELLSAELRSAYDIVLNGGTLEHVFHFVNGLTNTLEMVRVGGVFVHIGPLHNYVDHGFYHFSPTLFFDYAAVNRWRVTESAAIRISVVNNQVGPTEISPVPPNRFGAVGALDAAPTLHYLVMRREPASTTGIIPKQGYYRSAHADSAHGLASPANDIVDFRPYQIIGGRTIHAKPDA